MSPGPRPAVRGTGFTLVEVLLALAMAAMVVLAATGFLVGSSRADVAVSSASDSTLALDLAADLLGEELRRAGTTPNPPPGGVRLDGSVPSLTLVIGAGAQGDALAVRYVDDRLADGPVLRDLRFDAGIDGRGERQLYRRTASSHRQPLVQGIESLRVTGWADAAGIHGREAFAAGPLEPWLVLLELTAADGAVRTVAVPLPSRPPTKMLWAP